MKKWKLFVIPFVITILIERMFILLINNPEGIIYNDLFHHAYIGILILFVSGLIYGIKKRINMIFFGIGLGLFIDEIFLFISKGDGYYRYWNKASIYGTLYLMMLIIGIYFAFGNLKRKIKSSP